jgi:hypothetical protein
MKRTVGGFDASAPFDNKSPAKSDTYLRYGRYALLKAGQCPKRKQQKDLNFGESDPCLGGQSPFIESACGKAEPCLTSGGEAVA